MSAKVMATHVLSAILLVLAATFLVDVSLGARPAEFPMVRLVSYAGVIMIGGWLLWRALRKERAPLMQSPASGEGALPYFAGLSPCPLTTIIMVVALAHDIVKLGLLVSLSMALGMIVTVSLFALVVILSRRLLLDFLMRHAAHVERITRALEILGRDGGDRDRPAPLLGRDRLKPGSPARCSGSTAADGAIRCRDRCSAEAGLTATGTQ